MFSVLLQLLLSCLIKVSNLYKNCHLQMKMAVTEVSVNVHHKSVLKLLTSCTALNNYRIDI